MFSLQLCQLEMRQGSCLQLWLLSMPKLWVLETRSDFCCWKRGLAGRWLEGWHGAYLFKELCPPCQ